MLSSFKKEREETSAEYIVRAAGRPAGRAKN